MLPLIEHYIQSGLIEQKEERLKPAKSKVYSAGGLRFAMLSVFCHSAVIAVFIFGSNFMTPHKVNEPVLVIEAVLISPLKSQPATPIMNSTVDRLEPGHRHKTEEIEKNDSGQQSFQSGQETNEFADSILPVPSPKPSLRNERDQLADESSLDIMRLTRRHLAQEQTIDLKALANTEVQNYLTRKQNPLLSRPLESNQSTSDEKLLDDIIIEVDCNGLKGKLSALLSSNKTMLLSDRHFPIQDDKKPLIEGGSVKCKSQKDFDRFIQHRLHFGLPESLHQN